MKFQSQFVACLAVAACCGMLTGCGGGPDDMPELGQVAGTVTLDGSPLEGAEIAFQPTEGRPSHGTTDAEGKYTLKYTEQEEGARVGKHKVRITTYREADPGADDPALQQALPERIPAKYNAETTLEAEVKPGENEPIDFPLDSQGPIANPEDEEGSSQPSRRRDRKAANDC